jgi:hypothetical protein
LPMIILARSTTSFSQRILLMVKANIFLLFLMAGAITAFAIHPSLKFANFARLDVPIAIAQEVQYQIFHGLEGKAQTFGKIILGEYLADYAKVGLLFTLFYIILIKAMSAAGWIQLILACALTRLRGVYRSPKFQNLFVWLVLIALINASFILLSKFVLPKRYLFPIALVILIYASFGLAAMYSTWKPKLATRISRGWILPVTYMAIALQLLIILWPSNPKKRFEVDAAEWAVSHLPANSKIYYDSERLRYYAGAPFYLLKNYEGNFYLQKFTSEIPVTSPSSDINIRAYDYAVVHVPRKQPQALIQLNEKNGSVLATFDNGFGDNVVVLKVHR